MNSEQRFKVGDKVVDTCRTCLQYGVGTVETVNTEYELYTVDFENNSVFERYFSDRELVLWTPLIGALL
jgi:hypothetical protein